MPELLKMFLVFAKIGVMTFGGGYAMIPMLSRELAEKRDWTTDEELADYYAVGQCTPGVIAVNVATFIGSKRRGIPGGIAATLGVAFPSLVIICALAAVLSSFAQYEVVQHAFAGIRIAACALILSAKIRLLKKSVKDIAGAVIFAAVLLLSLFLKLSPVILVVASALTGIIIHCLGGAKK